MANSDDSSKAHRMIYSRLGKPVSLGLVLALAASGCHGTNGEIRDRLREVVSAPRPPAPLKGSRWKVLKQIYTDREFHPLWLSDGKPTSDARQLIATLCGAEREGLRPGDYGLADLEQTVRRAYPERKKPEAAALAALDLELTTRFLEYGADLIVGRLAPASVDSGWFIRARRSGADSILRAAAGGKSFPGMMDQLRPKRADYDQLVHALAAYRNIRDRGGWPKIDARGLARGAHGPRVAALRHRLEISGDLPKVTGKSAIYDSTLSGGVARFQQRHGIPGTGGIDAATLLALNTPVDYWIRQIEINLERYRWLPAEFGSKYIVVNIPDYHLFAFDGGKRALDMRVIVGEEYGNATPVFADSMSYIVFRPRWYVPRRILVDEVVPQVQRNIFYLAQNNFEVVDTTRRATVLDPMSIDWWAVDTLKPGFRVRQKSGAANSLGLVKFMFPNQFSIYLHDTPAGWLFQQQRRALSHGCVRVERPVELADFVLAGQNGWNDSAIAAAMHAHDSVSVGAVADTTAGQTVRLEHKVPVYILYLTAYVQEGVLNFRGDPYGKDAQAQKRLGAPDPRDVGRCEAINRALPH